MIIILIRTIVLYLFILLSLRIMGKTELSEMQPFQLVVLLLISELAAFSIGQTSLPLLNSIIAIIALMFIQIVLSLISMKSEKARGIICGKPSILINKGVIEEKELRRLRMNINDLLEHSEQKIFLDIDANCNPRNQWRLSVIPNLKTARYCRRYSKNLLPVAFLFP